MSCVCRVCQEDFDCYDDLDDHMHLEHDLCGDDMPELLDPEWDEYE